MQAFRASATHFSRKKTIWLTVTVILITLLLITPLWAYISSRMSLAPISPEELKAYNPAHIVILYRHAERCDRSLHACYAPNGGITVQGVQQASDMGKKVSAAFNEHYEIMSSDTLRTRQTAQFFANGKSVKVDPRLDDRECSDAQYQDFLSAIQNNDNNMKIVFTHSTCLNYFASRFAGGHFNADYLSNLILDVTHPQHIQVLGSLVLK